MSPTYFEIRSDKRFIRIDVISRNDANSYPDSLNAIISVQCGAFSGKFNLELYTNDFEKFRKELEVYVKEGGQGSCANFETPSEQVILHIRDIDENSFILECMLVDSAFIGNQLECRFDFHHKEILATIKALDHIINTFPTQSE